MMFFGSIASAQWGNAVIFDGSNGYITTSASSVLNVSTITIEAWIKPTSNGGDQEVIRLKGGYDDGCEIQVRSDGNVSFAANLPAGASWYNCVSSAVNAYDGSRHHVAATVDGENIALYVDGVQVMTNTGAGGLGEYGNVMVYLGQHPSGANQYMGWIDELRISNTIRYPSSFTRPDQPFTPDANTLLLFHFNESSGLTNSDASGNGIDGTMTGGISLLSSPFPVELTSFTASVSDLTTVLCVEDRNRSKQRRV